jgi:hypothetical protein
MEVDILVVRGTDDFELFVLDALLEVLGNQRFEDFLADLRRVHLRHHGGRSLAGAKPFQMNFLADFLGGFAGLFGERFDRDRDFEFVLTTFH